MSGNRHIVTRDALTDQISVPTTPVAATDASSKSYVDSVVGGVVTSGVWTPVFSTLNATVTSVTNAYSTFQRIGDIVNFMINCDVVITTDPPALAQWVFTLPVARTSGGFTAGQGGANVNLASPTSSTNDQESAGSAEPIGASETFSLSAKSVNTSGRCVIVGSYSLVN